MTKDLNEALKTLQTSTTFVTRPLGKSCLQQTQADFSADETTRTTITESLYISWLKFCPAHFHINRCQLLDSLAVFFLPFANPKIY